VSLRSRDVNHPRYLARGRDLVELAVVRFDGIQIPVDFSNPTARFDKIEGSMLLDQADLTKSSVSITLPLEGLDTHVAKLDEELRGPDFFDATRYPTITFHSTKVEKTGENSLKITGDLTVHGVTKPVTLDARVNKIGIFEIPGVIKAQTAGFDATTVIRRSDFGVSKYVPAVSDEIPVRITLDAKQALDARQAQAK
jgi:polyisoprenoid-binding protein YceI